MLGALQRAFFCDSEMQTKTVTLVSFFLFLPKKLSPITRALLKNQGKSTQNDCKFIWYTVLPWTHFWGKKNAYTHEWVAVAFSCCSWSRFFIYFFSHQNNKQPSFWEQSENFHFQTDYIFNHKKLIWMKAQESQLGEQQFPEQVDNVQVNFTMSKYLDHSRWLVGETPFY